MHKFGIRLFVLRRLSQTIASTNRVAPIQPNIDLGGQMKQLNDAKKYQEALSLFDAQQQVKLTNMAINQALQACIHLRDFHRGSNIHREFYSRSLSCHHMQLSLIQLYSKTLPLSYKDLI